MNSKKLQDRFEDVYRSFFQSHDVVLSTSLDVILNNDMAIELGGFLFYQKAPLKMYLGISRLNDSQGMRFGKLQQYHLSQQKYLDVPWPSYTEKLQDFLGDIIEEDCIIDVLIEDQRGTDLSFTGPLCALLATYAHLHSEQLSYLDVARFSQEKVSVVYGDPLFQLVLTTARDLIRCAKGNTLFGSCVLSALLSSYSPIICKTEGDVFDVVSACELGGVSDAQLPIDLCLLFSGMAVNPEYMLKDFDDIYQRYCDGSALSVEYFGSELLTSDAYWNYISSSWQASGMQFSDSLAQLYRVGESAEKQFFRNLNAIRFQLSQFCSPGLVLDSVVFAAYSYLSTHGQSDNFAVKHFYNRGAGGSLLCASSSLFAREYLDSYIADHDDFSYVFNSWDDGCGFEGVSVLQGFGKVSEWMKGALRFRNLENGMQSFDESCVSDYAVLFNAEENSLYVGGEKLDSKSIRSVSMTVAFVRLLFESSQVSSVDLPHSSFTESATEFSSKIIKPLLTIVKERLDIDLDFLVEKNDHGFVVTMRSGEKYLYLLDKIY